VERFVVGLIRSPINQSGVCIFWRIKIKCNPSGNQKEKSYMHEKAMPYQSMAQFIFFGYFIDLHFSLL
jgi:hypothetical protein